MTKYPQKSLASSLMQASIDGARSTKTQSSSPQVEANISEYWEDWVMLGTPAAPSSVAKLPLVANFYVILAPLIS